MKRCLLLLPALLLVAAADPAVERAARKEKVKLVGVWVQVPDVPGASPADLVDLGLMVHEITPQKITVTHVTFRDRKPATKTIGDGAYALDPTKDPRTVDLTIGGKVVPGIYQLGGDELSIATPTAEGGERPQKLVKSKDTRVMVLRRSPQKTLKDFVDSWEKLSQKTAENVTQGGLPKSRMAKPVDAAAKSLVIDIIRGAEPIVRAPGLEADSALKDLRPYLKKQHDDLVKSKPASIAVAFRASSNVDVSAVHEAAQAARVEGFSDVFLQVMRSSGDQGRLALVFPDWHRPIEDIIIRANREVGGDDAEALALDIKSGASVVRVENAESFEKQLKEQRDKAETLNKDSVRIRPNGRVSVAGLVQLMDSCLAAGFTRVSVGPLLELDSAPVVKASAPST
jgi:uncharacterized protein (TIGR03067 family)